MVSPDIQGSGGGMETARIEDDRNAASIGFSVLRMSGVNPRNQSAPRKEISVAASAIARVVRKRRSSEKRRITRSQPAIARRAPVIQRPVVEYDIEVALERYQ